MLKLMLIPYTSRIYVLLALCLLKKYFSKETNQKEVRVYI